jgi:hypothetical protein
MAEMTRRSSRGTALLDVAAREEVRFVGIVVVLLLVVTSIPTVFGYVSSPPDKWFSGITYNVHDTAQYLSWMREAGTSLLTDNKLTAEPNARVFVNLHWWIPGRLAHVFGLSLSQVYHLFRLVSVPLLALVTYAFCAALFPDRRKRRFAFLLGTFTSGLGWVWVVVKYIAGELYFPHDVYTTPGNAFWVMLASPHLAFAAALTLGVLLLALFSVERRRFGYALGAAGLALFLGLGHIYDLVTVWAVLALFGLLLVLRDGWSWRVFFSLGVVVLVSAPAALYWGWVSSDAHPAWQEALAQYDNLGAFTPDPPHLLILLGVTFLLALATFDGLVPLRDQADGGLLIKCWFVLVPFLVYLPLHFQVMLLTGYHLPMAVLATVGLFDRVLPWLRDRVSTGLMVRWLAGDRLGRLVPLLLLLVVAMTNLYLLAWRVVDLNRHDYPFYLYRDEVAAMRWLEEHTDPDEVVLSSLVVGHFIPGMTGDRAFLGSGVMTLNFGRKEAMVAAFFDSDTPESERQAVVQTYDVRYIFYGPAERALGEYDPAQSSFLSEVFDAPAVSVYRVIINEG